ncbi:MAG: glycosyltransferase family 39 protein [Candidatus Promineifilaceae bacterium]
MHVVGKEPKNKLVAPLSLAILQLVLVGVFILNSWSVHSQAELARLIRPIIKEGWIAIPWLFTLFGFSHALHLAGLSPKEANTRFKRRTWTVMGLYWLCWLLAFTPFAIYEYTNLARIADPIIVFAALQGFTPSLPGAGNLILWPLTAWLVFMAISFPVGRLLRASVARGVLVGVAVMLGLGLLSVGVGLGIAMLPDASLPPNTLGSASAEFILHRSPFGLFPYYLVGLFSGTLLLTNNVRVVRFRWLRPLLFVLIYAVWFGISAGEFDPLSSVRYLLTLLSCLLLSYWAIVATKSGEDVLPASRHTPLITISAFLLFLLQLTEPAQRLYWIFLGETLGLDHGLLRSFGLVVILAGVSFGAAWLLLALYARLNHQQVEARIPVIGKWAARMLVCAGLFLLLQITFKQGSAVAMGSDSSGYLNNAEIISQGQFSRSIRITPEFEQAGFHPWHFVPLGMRVHPADASRAVSTYPVGLSLLNAAVHLVVSDWYVSPKVVNVILTVISFVGMYFLGRVLGFSDYLSLVGVAFLACNPLFVTYTMQTMSDMPSTCCGIIAIVLAFYAKKSDMAAAGAGLAFGLAVLVRPTNIVFIIPILIALPFQLSTWIKFMLGGVPMGGLYFVSNKAMYDSFIASSYGDLSALFKFEYFPDRVKHFAFWFTSFLRPALMIGTLYGFVQLFVSRKKHYAVMFLWAAPTLVLYAFYFFSDETWWYTRFVLPTLPALIIMGLLAWHKLSQNELWSPSIALMSWFALPVALLVLSFHQDTYRILQVEPMDAYIADAFEAVDQHVSREDLLLADFFSGAVYFYTDYGAFRTPALMSRERAAAAADTLLMQGNTIYLLHNPVFETAILGGVYSAENWREVDSGPHWALWQFNPQ